MSMRIVLLPIQDEEIEMIEDFKSYIKKTTSKSVDDREAIMLLIKYFSKEFIK